jgi:NAD(P)-dependent dehydrogenase (short-subunit alcohol dehydrogenase family)
MINSNPDPLFDIREQVIVITGGGGVLPGALARGLAARGAHIALLSRTLSKAETNAEQIRAAGGRAMALEVDVTVREELERAAEQVMSEFGRIDHLINGAGGSRAGAAAANAELFFDLAADEMRAVFDLNLMGTVLPSQVFGKVMAAQKRGSILNFSSMSAIRPLTRVVGYSAAKAAVDSVTKWMALSLARDISPYLRVNAIAPGFFLADQNRAFLVNESGGLTARGESIIGHTPMARFGEPDELLAATVWLLSPGASFVTGIVVPIDGGFSAFSGV